MATVHPWNGADGPNPGLIAIKPGLIPSWIIQYVIATYAQTGGGISIF